jgi:hypothetical protein
MTVRKKHIGMILEIAVAMVISHFHRQFNFLHPLSRQGGIVRQAR